MKRLLKPPTCRLAATKARSLKDVVAVCGMHSGAVETQTSHFGRSEMVRRYSLRFESVTLAMLLSLVVASALLWPATATADNYLTQSQRVLCAVTPDSTLAGVGPDAVVCQGDFTQPGAGFNAVTTGNGSFYWENANLAVDNPTTAMAYGHTYHRGNWTIYHDAHGTRFTNDRTGHGMFVSIENVYAF
jgi:hypothetical protein